MYTPEKGDAFNTKKIAQPQRKANEITALPPGVIEGAHKQIPAQGSGEIKSMSLKAPYIPIEMVATRSIGSNNRNGTNDGVPESIDEAVVDNFALSYAEGEDPIELNGKLLEGASEFIQFTLNLAAHSVTRALLSRRTAADS